VFAVAGEGQSQDMDICSGDSTPTSETSFSVAQAGNVDNGSLATTGPVLLANTALTRLASQSAGQSASQLSGGSVATLSTLTSGSVSIATTSASTSSVRAALPMPVPVPVPVAGVAPPGAVLSSVSTQPVPSNPLASAPLSVPAPSSTSAPSSTAAAAASQQRLVYPKTGSCPGVSVSGGGGVQVAVTGSASNPPVTLASLPRLLSQITGTSALQSQEEQLSPQKALLTIQSFLTRQQAVAPAASAAGAAPTPDAAGAGIGVGPMAPLKVDTSHAGAAGEGPPTPTHSESQDCVDARKRELPCVVPPVAVVGHGPVAVGGAGAASRDGETPNVGVFPFGFVVSSPASSLSSLQTLSQTLSQGSSLHVLRPQGPNLTPSLANYYRDDLVNHVRGWPAELLEKQVKQLLILLLTINFFSTFLVLILDTPS